MKQYVIFSPQMLGVYGMGGFWSAGGDSWGALDGAALFCEDDTKKPASDLAYTTEADAVWLPLESAREVASQIAEGGYAKVRLTVDVTYFLNGEKAEDMRWRLDDAIRRLAGDGGLTGVTPAEVDEYSVETQIRLEVPPTVGAARGS